MISYLVTVSTELEEIKGLIPQILSFKRKQDEVVVLMDRGWFKLLTNPDRTEVWEYLDGLRMAKKIKFHEYNLKVGSDEIDFANFKNEGNRHCVGDYIFQVDADEALTRKLTVTIEQLTDAGHADLIWVPRKNLVEGLTLDHIDKWRWSVDKEGRVNWPDYQSRVYRNQPDEIMWQGKVHEQIVGHETYTRLPADTFACLHHTKTIERQEQQNNLYDSI